MSTWRVNDNEEPPADYLDLLYRDEEEEEEEEEVESYEDSDIEEDEAESYPGVHPPYSPTMSPDRERPPRMSEECEPELLHFTPLPSPERRAILQSMGEECDSSPELLPSPERRERMPRMDEQAPRPSATRNRSRSRSPLHLVSESAPAPAGVVLRIFDENGMPLDADADDGAFLSPDSHSLFVSPEERGRERRGRRGGRRSGRRGVRGVRGQSARGRGHSNRANRGNQWEVGHPLNEIWASDADVPLELVSMAMDVLRRRQMGMQDAARNAERESEVASESEDEDEFHEASDGLDGLPRLEGQNINFEWSPMDSFQGQEESFKLERTGSVHAFNSAYDAFRSFWDDGILGHIVAETNLYATKISSAAFQSEWFPTNIHEVLCLFSFWMMLGIIRLPTITSCFSVDPLLKTEVFRRIFTRRRYELLTRALHFVDSDPAMNSSNPSNTSAARSSDRIHRLRPIITHLNSRFQSNYILSKDICIDESLTLWKGRLNFKQYIQNKASKFGIKTFELCESATGYLWSFIVYAGKQSATDLEQSPGVLKSTAVVKKLIGPLLNKGYRLFMDNWYNSPLLARFLKLNGTDCVGTLRPSRRDVPIVINKAPLKRGELVARHSGDVSVLAWQDKKRITMISTCHTSSTALPTVSSRPTSRPVPFKPQVVLDYNKFMGGVDLKDQMLEPYLLERKRCAKWYMKLFKRLLNVSILNSRTLLQSSTSKHHDHLAFRLQLVDSILANHLSLCPQSRRYTVSSSRSTHEQPNRFIISTHWPILLEPTESSAAHNRNFKKRCFVCLREGRKNQKTSYCCQSCRVPLCVQNCFQSYHTPS